MSELQADVGLDDIDDIELDTNPEPDQLDEVDQSESAPEAEEKVTFTEAQQKVIDDLAAKKTFKIREAERKAEQLQKELEAVQAKIPKEAPPQIPDKPDPYSDNYEDQFANWEAARVARAEFDARERMRQQEQDQLAYQAEQEQQQVVAEKISEYSNRAKSLGVDAQELAQAGSIVQQYDLNDQIVMHILQDDQGPLITKYLSQNPQALDYIRQSDPLSAAVYISTDIKAKAAGLAVKKPTAPDPVETLNGAGVAPNQRGPKGATFT